jgi:hypothetical protein
VPSGKSGRRLPMYLERQVMKEVIMCVSEFECKNFLFLPFLFSLFIFLNLCAFVCVVARVNISLIYYLTAWSKTIKFYVILFLLFSGSLLPSHGLPPFGANITNIAMSESLCGTSMFGSDRWSVGVNPMTAGKLSSYCSNL